MADRPTNPDNGNDTGVRTTEDRPPAIPRWVKVSGSIIGLLVLLVVGVMIFDGGNHGPGRHLPGGQTPPGGGH
ncbi:MAG TPA: hypothetical protein VD902_01290 [Symbiobacteriaceae bacterium]|nr:hypothetical protein [Symbiobacteriaceae bacterium]